MTYMTLYSNYKSMSHIARILRLLSFFMHDNDCLDCMRHLQSNIVWVFAHSTTLTYITSSGHELANNNRWRTLSQQIINHILSYDVLYWSMVVLDLYYIRFGKGHY